MTGKSATTESDVIAAAVDSVTVSVEFEQLPRVIRAKTAASFLSGFLVITSV
jgi:hypothetical protein